MKVLVCGAKGMLGTDMCQIFSQEGHVVTGLDIGEIDITRLADVRQTLKELKPELIINAAAYTNVDGCEQEPDLAYRVNALGPRNLAIGAEETGAALIHISTDYVFGGRGNRPYREYDPILPASVYGKSKADGEEMVRNHCRRHYIVRTAWLFGVNGNNFVKTMLRLAGERDVLTVVNDQVGSPTYTCDLGEALAKLCQEPAYGTYHLTNGGSCTWFEFTREILRQAGVSGVRVEPITTEELGRPADRPRYSVLDNYIWRMDGRSPLRPYQEALTDYLKQTKVI